MGELRTNGDPNFRISEQGLPIAPNLIETVNQWNDEGYYIEIFGENPSVIILGEMHFTNAYTTRRKQAELIRTVQPEYVLHEFLTGYIYDPATKLFTPNKGRNFNSVDRSMGVGRTPDILMGVANEVGCKIIGCDLTMADYDEAEKEIAMLFPDEYLLEGEPGYRILTKRDDPNWIFTAIDDLAIFFRDRFMAGSINEYSSRTQRPVIAILGAEHLRNISRDGLLTGAGVSYIHVDQTGNKPQE